MCLMARHKCVCVSISRSFKSQSCLFVCLHSSICPSICACIPSINLFTYIFLSVLVQLYVCPFMCVFVHTFVRLSFCPTILSVCLSNEANFPHVFSQQPPSPPRNPHPLFIPAVANKYLSKFDTPMSCSQGKIRFAEIFYVHFNPLYFLSG